ncbi:MAG: hypothetical protein EBV06_02400 [Planctomycetia bacterium]|nr:hypothetical protein [Planctomycetia bacterium]
MAHITGLQRPGPSVLERFLGAALGVLSAVFAVPVMLIVPVWALGARDIPPYLVFAVTASAAIAAGLGWLAARIWLGLWLPRWFMVGFWLTGLVGALSAIVGTLVDGKPLMSLVFLQIAVMVWFSRAGFFQGGEDAVAVTSFPK